MFTYFLGADTRAFVDEIPARAVISKEKPMPPADAPGGIIDLWEPTAVHHLTDKHMVSVLGAELRVHGCRPAERGGDFYVLEAAKDEASSHGGTAVGLVVIEVDRNQLVNARLSSDESFAGPRPRPSG
jgi:hypothetical protein